jgi:predicted Rossmann fold nucleotide-binding protein DprA/Smf involved in DNA uptake
MVDRSSLVLAVYNGQGKGGTYTTLCYALSHQRTVTILEP